MQSNSYYGMLTDPEANRAVYNIPLLVNCSGTVYSTDTPSESRMRKRKDYYLIFVIGGKINLTINNNIQKLSKNCFIIIEPQTRFEQSIPGGFINYYWLHFTGNYAYDLIKTINITLNTVYSATFDDKIKKLFDNIFNELMFTPPFYETNLSGLLINLLTQISRARADIVFKKMKSIEYINEHYNENITIEQLAKMENMSVSYFRSVFKKTTGIAPSKYILIKRIDAACFYFEHYNMPIKEVAFAVGYEDPLYFSKIFKKITGISPKNYAKT